MPNATVIIAGYEVLIDEGNEVTTVTSSNADVVTVVAAALKNKIRVNIHRKSDDTLSMNPHEAKVPGGPTGSLPPSVRYIKEICDQLAKEIPDEEALQTRLEPIRNANSLESAAETATTEGRAYAYARKITKPYADAAIACLKQNEQAPGRDLAEKIRDAIINAHLNPKVDKTPGV